MVKLIFIGSRDFIRLPAIEGLNIELEAYDADPTLNSFAIGDDEEVTLNLTNDLKWSSIYKPSSLFDNYIGYGTSEKDPQGIRETLRIKSKKLDTIYKDNLNKNNPHIIAINAQGSSFEILKNAPKILESTAVILCECEFVKIYQDQPTFGEVFNFLESKGFQLLDLNLLRAYKKSRLFSLGLYDFIGKGELMYADAVYVRNDLSLYIEKDILEILKFITKLGFLSTALDHLEKTGHSKHSDQLISIAKNLKKRTILDYLPKYISLKLFEFFADRFLSQYPMKNPKFFHCKDRNRIDKEFKY